jgi:signal peptidase I
VSTDLPSSEQPGPTEVVGLKDPPPTAPDGDIAEPAARAPRPRPSAKRRLTEWAIIIVVALTVALVLRAFVVQTFYIPSPSMTPTLKVGDRIVVDKLAYHLHGVGRGDIIVFKRPPAENCGTPVTDLVKRVIGLPGETISDKNGTIYIDGKALLQPWLPKNDPDTYTPTFAPVKIPSNSYFVMGDDRTVSCDSRYWGTVPRSLIVGKVDMRVWPLDRIAFF